MATPKLTEQEIHSACADFVAQGERPTTLKLFDSLGRGSLTTISKYLNSWKQTEEAQVLDAESLPAVVQLPDNLAKDGEEFLKKIWNVAKGSADREIEVQRVALKQAEKDSQARVEEAFAFSDAQAMKIERLEDEIKALQAQLDNECKQHAADLHNLATAEKVNVGLEKDKERLENELSTTTARIAEQKELIKTHEKENKAQHDSYALELKKKEEAIKLLEQQVYSTSDSNKKLTDDFKNKDSELSSRTIELEQLRGRYESTFEDLAETKKQLNAATKATNDVEKRIAKLEGQLETYQTLNKQEG